MAYVLWNLGKAMVLRMQNHPDNNIEIPNLNKPPIKLIFDLPFELRIAVAFVSLWIGFIAFDHITDIVARKYEWLMAVLGISIIGIFLKNTMGIGPSQEDIIALFEEDRREKLHDVISSKNWKVVSSMDDVPSAIGKTIALQFVSNQYGTLYLNDERKQYLSFSKRIEQASKFQLIGVPSSEGVDNVAFYSHSRKQFLSNTILGYLKVESTSMGSWEIFQLDFVTDHNKATDMFQLKSVSRGRHLMHQKEGNFHKGFHDKYGEVAYFRMLYYDGDERQLEESDEDSPNISDVLMDYDEHAEISSTESLSLVSLSSSNSSSPLTNQNYADWKLVTRKARIPKSNPVVIEIEGEGFLEANHNGYITFSPTPENSTMFQVCKNPNESTMGFYSRQHQKYLSLSGILSNKIKVCANKLDNWEKFKLHFDRDTKGLCYVKNLKVWPNIVLTKAHFGGEDKSRAFVRLWYNDKIPLSSV